MKNLIGLLLAGVWMLAACSGGASATLEIDGPMGSETAVVVAPRQTQAEALQSEQPATPAAAQPETATPAAAQPETATPAAQASAAGDLVVYKIVPGESKAEYQVGETFFSQNNRFNLAVGVTPVVNGEITLDMANPQNAQVGVVTVDISRLQSDSGRRDGIIRDRWLESSTYPVATFTPTKIEGLPTAYNMGDEITFQITGDLTVRQATLPVTFEVKARLLNNELSGTAETTVSLGDFGVGPIEIAGMLKTEDTARLVLNFVARP